VRAALAPPAQSAVPACSALAVTPGWFDSRIVSDFPAIFAELSGKSFKLRGRGNCDSFSASQPHGRCNGSANALKEILDTKRNIIGLFMPVEWDRQKWKWKWKWKLNEKIEDGHNSRKANDSEKSFVFVFIFTLTNAHKLQSPFSATNRSSDALNNSRGLTRDDQLPPAESVRPAIWDMSKQAWNDEMFHN
jgi:hypothetical protein